MLKIAAIYLGTVLGAGFASGQEHILFFVRFLRRGMLGCLLAGILFCLLGALILKESHGLLKKTHRCYLASLFGKRFASAFAFITELFLCISFCIMLSGTGAFFKERLSLPPIYGILLTDAICLAVFLYDLQGLSAVNLLLTPFMLLGTMYVCLHALFTGTTAAWAPQIHPHGQFLPYALFYVGYNLLTATAVLVPASALAPDKKTAAFGGVLGGLALSLMAILCCLALYVTPQVHGAALPMLLLSEQAGELAYVCYSAVLYMAMLTTAVSTGFSVRQRLVSLGLAPRKSAAFVCLIALPLSLVEFSVLIERFYVFFGIFGMLLMFAILWKWYKNKE
ncbi:MAG: hypothetical protein E7414_05460 [Ruminococcaceae bacterium]|nr:hypothetical protein [Oscillospiraceae bacterium]